MVVAALITASIVLVAALAWLAGTAKADAAGSGVPSSAVYHSLRSVVVMPGQSLWSLATRYEPTADPRNVIQEIIDLNALNGTRSSRVNACGCRADERATRRAPPSAARRLAR